MKFTFEVSRDLTPRIGVIYPFPHYHLPALWEWIEQFRHKLLDDYGPQNQSQFVDLYLERLKGGDHSWGVVEDGRIVGLVQVSLTTENGVAETTSVWRRQSWSPKLIVPALVDVYGTVYSSGVRKLQATIFADFHAMADMLQKVGFQPEGRIRGARLRDQQPVDVKVYGMFQEEMKLCGDNSLAQASACSAAL